MSRSRTGGKLTGEQRDLLAALADVIFPAAEGMPAASELDLTGEWVERALSAMPSGVEDDLVRVLADIPDAAADAAAVVDRLGREQSADLDVLVSVISGAYYLHPTVRSLIGYPGQRPRALPAEEVSDSPFYLLGGPLDRVRKRGPIYRPTP
jgi:hypothetical protein